MKLNHFYITRNIVIEYESKQFLHHMKSYKLVYFNQFISINLVINSFIVLHLMKYLPTKRSLDVRSYLNRLQISNFVNK